MRREIYRNVNHLRTKSYNLVDTPEHTMELVRTSYNYVEVQHDDAHTEEDDMVGNPVCENFTNKCLSKMIITFGIIKYMYRLYLTYFFGPV